jgi:hypothetical protein
MSHPDNPAIKICIPVTEGPQWIPPPGDEAVLPPLPWGLKRTQQVSNAIILVCKSFPSYLKLSMRVIQIIQGYLATLIHCRAIPHLEYVFLNKCPDISIHHRIVKGNHRLPAEGFLRRLQGI